ncbi:hypothetical protein MMC19_004521 [Ptychographa xylographoides]|nr:hypothetical protein [Ptychographa xylographoides]
MSSDVLPASRFLLTSLFSSLPSSPFDLSENPQSNPLINVSTSTKSLLLTLHCLFPNVLLPALDLLDRGLVKRLVLPPVSESSTLNAITVIPAAQKSTIAPGVPTKHQVVSVYYVRSAQNVRYHSRHQVTTSSTTSYEVRLDAWNCTCAAFTFAAFSVLGRDDRRGTNVAVGEDKERGWFGGLADIEEEIPICKHLLACILIERCGLLRCFIEEVFVSRDEAAGWVAGWAD